MKAFFSSCCGSLSGPCGAVLRDVGLVLLRAGAGGMMAAGHGWGKLAAYAEKAEQFPDPLGLGGPATMALAVFSEFFCSALVVLGLATRLAAIFPAATMLTAVLVVHANDPWARKEIAALYLVAFATLILTGPGRFSIDALIGARCGHGKAK